MENRIEEIVAKALGRMGDNRYRFSLVVTKRAEQLADGATPLVNIDESKLKFTDITLYKIAEGKITLKGLVETSR